jgi:hypothetical protein
LAAGFEVKVVVVGHAACGGLFSGDADKIEGMATVPVPGSLDDVSPGWVAAALSVAHPGTRVDGVAAVDVIHGSLTKARLAVDYGDNPKGLPGSIFLKAAFEDHGIPVSVRSEAVFYDVARPRIDVIAPGCLAAIHDDDHGAVLMHDLDSEGATITDPCLPWSVDLVADGLTQLAGLHARWWGEGLVEGIPDFEGSNALGAVLMAESYWEDCVAGPTWVHVPERFADRETTRPWVEALWRLDIERPRAFLHGDAHLGNTYVTADGRAAFLDWGGVKAGHWAREVCYFMAGALGVDDRRAHEEELLRGYLDVLSGHDAVPAPGWDEAWLSYRRHFLHGLLWFLCPTQMQPVDIINANVERFAAAATDHEVDSLF